ncbi:hypothetical protein MBANPS3_011536 [Mucor bainieri]
MQEKHNLFIENIPQAHCPSMEEKQQITTPLQSPDLLRYYYMTQLLRARTNSSRGSQDFEDYMFKEDATTTSEDE